VRPNINLVTLGVSDLERSKKFYCEGLGLPATEQANEGIVFIPLSNIVLGLFPRSELAKDANVSPNGDGFRSVSLAHNVSSEDDVEAVLAEAKSAGATIVKPAEKVFWGGYSGYFSDPDGHLWEVAYNPFWPIDENGNVVLK